MKNIDFTPIIEALIALLSAIITLVIIPKVRSYLAAKLSAEQRENLKQWVKVAVAAAEQLYGSKTGLEKKDYVVSFLLSKGIVFDIDEVTALIESEVYKIKQNAVLPVSETTDNNDECTDLFDMCEPVPDENKNDDAREDAAEDLLKS